MMNPARTAIRLTAISCVAALALWGQQFSFNLDYLGARGADVVDIALDHNMLQFAAKFLDGKDADEAKVKSLILGIDGIYVKSFEFKNEGSYHDSDLAKIRAQMKAPEWARIFGVKSGEDRETVEVYVRSERGKVTGVAILASGPKELTVANLVGRIDLDSLAALGGHFGIPKVPAKK
jgi:hypothetical protein